MLLDEVTERNLEIFKRLDGGKGQGTLWQVLDRTMTPMGGRLLETMLRQPWLDLAPITETQEAVALFFEDPDRRAAMREILDGVYDLERLTTRIFLNRGRAQGLHGPAPVPGPFCPPCAKAWPDSPRRPRPWPKSSPAGTTSRHPRPCSPGPWWTARRPWSPRAECSGRATIRTWTNSWNSPSTARAGCAICCARNRKTATCPSSSSATIGCSAIISSCPGQRAIPGPFRAPPDPGQLRTLRHPDPQGA